MPLKQLATLGYRMQPAKICRLAPCSKSPASTRGAPFVFMAFLVSHIIVLFDSLKSGTAKVRRYARLCSTRELCACDPS